MPVRRYSSRTRSLSKSRNYRKNRKLSMKNRRQQRRRNSKKGKSLIKRRMRGGKSTVMPSEYFGKASGRYSAEEFSNPGEFAYGVYTPQSYGENFDGKSHGPNMGVYPASSMQQTGGYRKRKSKRNRRSKRNQRK